MLVTGDDQGSRNNWCIVGASRGLGLAIAHELAQRPSTAKLILMSRKILSQPPVDFFVDCVASVERHAFDANDESQWSMLLQQNVERIIYVSGGGPYGDYESKKWSDHMWAWRVIFLCPAFLLHQALLLKKNKQTQLQQICVVGSAIADSQPDPQAASYAAAKHALRGLLTTLQEEQKTSALLDLRLYRPGYIDTSMLPANAWPRQSQQTQVAHPQELAKQLVDTLLARA